MIPRSARMQLTEQDLADELQDGSFSPSAPNVPCPALNVSSYHIVWWIEFLEYLFVRIIADAHNCMFTITTALVHENTDRSCARRCAALAHSSMIVGASQSFGAPRMRVMICATPHDTPHYSASWLRFDATSLLCAGEHGDVAGFYLGERSDMWWATHRLPMRQPKCTSSRYGSSMQQPAPAQQQQVM